MTMPVPAFSQEVIALIQQAKQRAAVAINSEITLLYWHIGQRINQEVLRGERADYGKQVVANLAKQLTAQFGKGWSAQQLRHCMKFAECYSDEQIVSALRRQLSWTHIKALIYIDAPLKRDFYAQMAIAEGWSTRTLDERIGAMLYERTAISKKPDETIRAELLALSDDGNLNPNLVLKDPYLLDFLDLSDRYLEKDLEDAILRDIYPRDLKVQEGGKRMSPHEHR